MVFSSIPLYHLDPQAWHHQQINDHQQVLQENKYDYDLTTSPQVPPAQQTPSSQDDVGCGGSMTTGSIKPNSMVDRARQAQLPLPEPGLKCPRCDSINTKFCYFNNYNLSQPRHFCKACRRYWTRGGSLRNVPVGGGCRRTAKRSKSRSSSAGPGGGTRSLGTPISSNLVGGGNLLMSNNFHQLPFLPSLHNLGSSNPSGIGLDLLGNGGVEMEFPNLLASFEGLGRINNGMQQHFENSSHNMNLIGHSFQSKPLDIDLDVFDRRAVVKFEDPRGLNLAKEFALIQEGNQQHHHHQLINWNTNGWSNGSDNLSGFASPSAANHFLG